MRFWVAEALLGSDGIEEVLVEPRLGEGEFEGFQAWTAEQESGS